MSEQCAFGCAIFGDDQDVADHERDEHVTCSDCGNEPIGSYPVAHKPSCSRMTIAPHLWPSPTEANGGTGEAQEGSHV